jgi:hypothetical protein
VYADKAYDTRVIVKECRALNVTPHMAQNLKRSGDSAIDAHTTRTARWLRGQPDQEDMHRTVFGRARSIGPMRQVIARSPAKVDQVFMLTMAAHSLTRLRGLAGFRP